LKPETHYVHRLHYTAQERLAGLFVLSALAILIVLLLLSSQNLKLLQGRVEFVALMRTPVGISTDTRVHISGIEAGSVKRIALMPDNRFKIVLSIYKEYKNLVRADSMASISKLALIGDSVIDISPGSADQPLLGDGGAIEVRETMTLDQMLVNLRPMLDKINISIDRIATVLSGLPEHAIHSTLEDAAAVTAQLRQGRGIAGALLYDEQMKTELKASIQALHETLAISTGIARDSRDIMAQLKATTDILHQQMQLVPEMALKTHDLIDNTRKTVDAIGHTWPVSTNMPESNAPEGPDVMASND
jgi:phospholipid/cholesterol/gamma-HCH transport system substrate-binding protein